LAKLQARSTTSVLDAQSLVHQGAGRGVLQAYLLFRVNVLLHRESGERRFVKPTQNQLFLARIAVDVADGEDAGHVGLELFRIHLELPFVQFETPLRNWTQVGGQAPEDEDFVGLEVVVFALRIDDLEAADGPSANAFICLTDAGCARYSARR
jgi:hypothetical protein